jgi:hypothetical protein
MFEDLDDAIRPWFFNGKKLTGSNLKTIFHECCMRMMQASPIVDGVQNIHEATRVHPKGEMYQARCVGVKLADDEKWMNDELYQLFNFRIFATRKLVVLDFQQQPFGFKYHTAERLLERGVAKNLAIDRLTEAVYFWSEVLIETRTIAARDFSNRMFLPMPDGTGALLGEYMPMNMHAGVRRTFNHIGAFDTPLISDASDFGYLTRTFVSTDMMSRRQRRLMDELLEWAVQHSEERLAAARRHFWRAHLRDDQLEWKGLPEIPLQSLMKIFESPETRSTIIGC